MSLSATCPSSVNCGPLVPILFLVGYFLVFIIMALDYRLHRPLKFRALLFWISPLFYVYVMLTLFGGIALLAWTGSFSSNLQILESIGSLIVGGLVGVALGGFIGRRVKIGVYPDGKRWFHGGLGLVALLWILLIPRAVVSAVDLVNVSSWTGVSALVNSQWFLLFTVYGGALFVLSATLTITWKSEVTARFVELRNPGGTPR